MNWFDVKCLIVELQGSFLIPKHYAKLLTEFFLFLLIFLIKLSIKSLILILHVNQRAIIRNCNRIFAPC